MKSNTKNNFQPPSPTRQLFTKNNNEKDTKTRTKDFLLDCGCIINYNYFIYLLFIYLLFIYLLFIYIFIIYILLFLLIINYINYYNYNYYYITY